MTVQLDVLAQGVTVRFDGIDRLAGCRRELFIPFDRVLGARVMTRTDAVASSPRLAAPGVSWPHRLRVGCWGVGERRQLWAVRDGRDVVVVYLSGRPFHRLVVDVEQPWVTHGSLDAALMHSKTSAPRRSMRIPGAEPAQRGPAVSREGTSADG